MRIHPYIVAGIGRKFWTTYSIHDGHAEIKSWPGERKSIPLLEATIDREKSFKALLRLGTIKITSVSGSVQEWTNVPDVDRVYKALVRASKGLPPEAALRTQKRISYWIDWKFWNSEDSPRNRFKPKDDEEFRQMSVEQLLNKAEEAVSFAESNAEKPETRLLLDWLDWSYLLRIEALLVSDNREHFDNFDNLANLKEQFNVLDKRVQEARGNSLWASRD